MSDVDNQHVRMRKALQQLAQGGGVERKNLLDLLDSPGGELQLLRDMWGIDRRNGLVSAQTAIRAHILGSLTQVGPPNRRPRDLGHVELGAWDRKRQFRRVIQVLFNIWQGSLRGKEHMTLGQRYEWLDGASNLTDDGVSLRINKHAARRDFEYAIDRLAEVFASGGRASAEPSSSDQVFTELVTLRQQRGISILRVRREAPQIKKLALTLDEAKNRQLAENDFHIAGYYAVKCAVNQAIEAPEWVHILRNTLNFSKLPGGIDERRKCLSVELGIQLSELEERETEAFVELSGILVAHSRSFCRRPTQEREVSIDLKVRLSNVALLEELLTILSIEDRRYLREAISNEILNRIPGGRHHVYHASSAYRPRDDSEAADWLLYAAIRTAPPNYGAVSVETMLPAPVMEELLVGRQFHYYSQLERFVRGYAALNESQRHLGVLFFFDKSISISILCRWIQDTEAVGERAWSLLLTEELMASLSDSPGRTV